MNIKNIGVVGGGTAGFVSALILKSRYPNCQVDLIKSDTIGIVGVGEGSTEHWAEFMKYVGINHQHILRQCGATYKTGIMFKGWAEEDYLHSTHADFDKKTGQYLYYYGRQIGNEYPQKTLTLGHIWKNQLELGTIEDKNPPFNQFHFDTFKLNEFLHHWAELKGIRIINDEILEIPTNENGIEILKGKKENYLYDFYVDATGFKKLLISKLGAKWTSYSDYLKVDSAITFPIENDNEYNLWTVAQAMKYGWMFKIPVQGRYGNGYIFDSKFIDANAAKKEVEDFLGHEINVGKNIKFDPGALDKVWIKNCCAIGLSASFVEPLEASSIGSSIQQSFLLMHRLPNYTQDTIDDYNRDVNSLLENIRDFVLLHYITDREDTEFWKQYKTLKLPKSLEKNLRRWTNNLPIEEDFNNLTKYIMFREANFSQVMHGLKLFNSKKILEEFEMQHPEIKKLAKTGLEEIRIYESVIKTIGHKRYIDLLKEYV